MHAVGPSPNRGIHAGRLQAHDRKLLPRPIDDACALVQIPYAHSSRFQRKSQALSAVSQSLLGALAFADVAQQNRKDSLSIQCQLRDRGFGGEFFAALSKSPNLLALADLARTAGGIAEPAN